MRGPVFRAVEHVRTGKPYRLGTVPGRGRIRVTRGADSTAGKYTGCRCAIWGRVQITHQPDRPIARIGIPPLQNRLAK